MQLPLYTIQGEKKGTVDVPEGIFAVSASPELVHQVVVSAQSNLRTIYAHSKDRSEVSGGGRKPWKQKGTGRARHGSTRSPLWVGGGVAFGPTKDRNFHKKINKKMNRKALCAELSDKAAKNALCVAETFRFEEAKTKNGVLFLQHMLASLPPQKTADEKKINKKKMFGSVVIWGTPADENFSRVFSNIPHVDARRVENINILDVMGHTHAVFSQSALASFIGTKGDKSVFAPETIKKEKISRVKKIQDAKGKRSTTSKRTSTKAKSR